jgi:hypothetical protein
MVLVSMACPSVVRGRIIIIIIYMKFPLLYATISTAVVQATV